MDLATVLVLVAMLILTGAFITRPLAAGEGRTVGERERRLSALYAQQDQILSFLQELDMDFTMGKILPEDHVAQRAEWVARGADVLREIDELRSDGAEGAASNEMEARLEAKVAGLRRTLAHEGEDDLEGRLEAEVARVRESLKTVSGYCGHCGNALVSGDRFCPRCGTPVPVAGTPA